MTRVRFLAPLMGAVFLLACSDRAPSDIAADSDNGGQGGSGGAPGAGGSQPAGASGSSAGSAGSTGGIGSGGSAQVGAGNGGGGRVNEGGSAGQGTAGSGGQAESNECDGAPELDPTLLAECSGTPQNCALGGEAGHYDVRVLLGGAAVGSTRIEAESRRFMLGETPTQAGEAVCRSFTVNVRTPEGQPIQASAPHGTDGLNFRVLGDMPGLVSFGFAKASNPVVLFIAGDSTVCDQDPQLDVEPNLRFTGWGQVLPRYFKRGISIANYADSGEGSAAFRTDGGGLWKPIGDNLKVGDFLFIQLGHNDKTTPAATYRSRITGMVSAAKAKGATPVLVTPIVRNNGSPLAEQQIYGDLDVRAELMQIAANESVPLIDLLAKSAAWVEEVGRTTAQTYYVGTDSTHTNELGAKVFAEFVVDGVVEDELSIASYLR